MKGAVIGFALVVHGLGAELAAQEVFTAEVLLERSTVDDKGRTISSTVPSRFRLTESLRSGEPVISLTYLPAPGLPPTGAASDRLAGMRVELDANGRSLRVFDRSGKEIDLAQEKKPPSSVLGRKRSAHATPFVRKARALERLRELRGDLGGPVGKVRGFERYVQSKGSDAVEVLVLMPQAVTVEVNVIRDGALESHATYQYDELQDGSLFQRVSRTETRIPDRNGERAVVQMTYSNVTTGQAR
jgi:hypothetical protein